MKTAVVSQILTLFTASNKMISNNCLQTTHELLRNAKGGNPNIAGSPLSTQLISQLNQSVVFSHNETEFAHEILSRRKQNDTRTKLILDFLHRTDKIIQMTENREQWDHS